ncbi:MAG: NYN domain-containing protein [Saprospiraceae bacterium]
MSTTKAMNANVAVLYDIENLIGGYSPTIRNTKRLKPNISIQSILDKINRITGFSSKESIQRAYANWNISTIKYIKEEIEELNIKAVSMAGMPYNRVKNAADFHLIVDAMHLIYKRPEIDTYILVTGDGGFSVLANELQKLGKTVIGCSIIDRSSKIFQQVCDNFILLRYKDIAKKGVNKQFEEIKTTPNHRKSDLDWGQGKPNKVKKVILSKTKKLIKIAKHYTHPLTEEDTNDSVKAQAVMTGLLNCMMKEKSLAQKIQSKGLKINLFRGLLYEFLGYDFDFKKYGCYSLFEFINRMLRNTPLTLFQKEANFRIGFKKEGIQGYKEWIAKHSIENYRKILLEKSPLYRLPSERCTLYDVLVELKMSRNLSGKTFSVMAKNLAQQLGKGHITMVKNVLHVLVLANCFDEKYKQFPFMERPLTLKRHLYTEKDILNQLHQHLRPQLKKGLSKGIRKGVNDFVLGSLI